MIFFHCWHGLVFVVKNGCFLCSGLTMFANISFRNLLDFFYSQCDIALITWSAMFVNICLLLIHCILDSRWNHTVAKCMFFFHSSQFKSLLKYLQCILFLFILLFFRPLWDIHWSYRPILFMLECTRGSRPSSGAQWERVMLPFRSWP